MHPADIKANLHKRGITFTRVAHDLDLTPGTVSAVINSKKSKRVSRRIATHVSRLIGIRVSRLWPDLYPESPRGPA